MVSGEVKRELEKILDNPQTTYTLVTKAELDISCKNLTDLIVKRNALIHAHPVTDHDGSQILSYQTNLDRKLTDMKWPVAEVETAIAEFDQAACSVNELLHRLLRQATWCLPFYVVDSQATARSSLSHINQLRKHRHRCVGCFA